MRLLSGKAKPAIGLGDGVESAFLWQGESERDGIYRIFHGSTEELIDLAPPRLPRLPFLAKRAPRAVPAPLAPLAPVATPPSRIVLTSSCGKYGKWGEAGRNV